MVYVICQWARQERAFRLRAAAREFTVAIGADYTRILCRLTFAADGAAAASTLGVADAVGVVDADRGALPVAYVVGKVPPLTLQRFLCRIFRRFSTYFQA